MSESRVLVAGATGLLGSAIVRKLAASGLPVRALARSREKLAMLAGPGVEIAPVDMLDVPALNEACRGVTQIVATANNNMGTGASSPKRVDLAAYQNLCAAARNAGKPRLIFISSIGIERDSPVDIFRVKWFIEDAIRRSGVPHVILRPTAFMDIWVDLLMAPEIRKKGTALIFGDGTGVANYIAIDDLAEFVRKILARTEIVSETIEIGGPSNISLNDLTTLIERRLGASGRRRHVPEIALRLLPALVRPFNEVRARMMTLGHHATLPKAFAAWNVAAERFGVAPRTIEQYVGEMKS